MDVPISNQVPEERLNSELRRSWVANSTAWRDAVREHRIESRRTVTDAAIVAAVLEQSPRSVLDVGCGEGWLARELSSRGIAVTGIDASAPLIEAAAHGIEDEGLRIEDFRGSSPSILKPPSSIPTFLAVSYEELAKDPSSVGGPFDVAVANFSILDDRPDRWLPALAHSTLIVQTVHPLAAGDPYVDGWRTETFASIPGPWAEPMPWYFRTLSSWHRLLTTARYAVVEIREPRAEGSAGPASLILIGRPQALKRTTVSSRSRRDP